MNAGVTIHQNNSVLNNFTIFTFRFLVKNNTGHNISNVQFHLCLEDAFLEDSLLTMSTNYINASSGSINLSWNGISQTNLLTNPSNVTLSDLSSFSIITSLIFSMPVHCVAGLVYVTGTINDSNCNTQLLESLCICPPS